jgi:type II secretory pathway pseudopilin PulG
MPRLQGAQGRARDIARQTALSNIGSAIVLYQGDHGTFPK